MTIEDQIRKMHEACKDGMKPSPCVTCRKITSLYLRSSSGPIPYCGECFTAELEASHKSLLRQAKAAGFKTVGAWQDWHEQQACQEASLPKGDWE
jgi:hypothetical protein